MPVLLLNKERVAAEVMELARIKISTALNVPIKAVDAKWERSEGKLVPSFGVDTSKIQDPKKRQAVHDADPDETKRTLGAIWRWLKDSLNERLLGLGDVRG